jgi:hypothetical protein
LEQIQRIRQVLKGEKLVPVEEAFRITRSLPQGHVQAVLTMVRRVGNAIPVLVSPGSCASGR